MTPLELEITGRAPAGWRLCPPADRSRDTHIDFTLDSEPEQRFVPRMTLSVLETVDPSISLETHARRRRQIVYAADSGAQLRRGEFISRRDPAVYGQVIRFETEVSPGERVAVMHSEILFDLMRSSKQILIFLLTAPELIFEDCARDFAVFVKSVVVQESG